MERVLVLGFSMLMGVSAVVLSFLCVGCDGSNDTVVGLSDDQTRYAGFSRFTDPKELSGMLEGLPDDVYGICEIAKEQTVHRNLLPYSDVPETERRYLVVWPPKMINLLNLLRISGSGNLFDDRPATQRIKGACILESHFLAGLLRYKGIPVRIRVGYFKDISANREHFLSFWMKVARSREWSRTLLNEDPEQWEKDMYQLLNKQIEDNHYIEHWICEYWNIEDREWRLLDANSTFLKASSGIDVGFHLPIKHFEYAHEAWIKLRNDDDFVPDQYRESGQDGPSHIRGQLLWDFYSLLNRDLVGHDEPSRDSYAFIKDKKYEDLSELELTELDSLAELLSGDPSIEALVSFYFESKTLRRPFAETDSYSFVYAVTE